METYSLESNRRQKENRLQVFKILEVFIFELLLNSRDALSKLYELHEAMSLQVGDFVRRVDASNVRGHISNIDGDMIAVTVGDVTESYLAEDWEEVQDGDSEVMASLYLSMRDT